MAFSAISHFVLTSFHLTATINELRIWMNSVSLLLDPFFFYTIETGEKAEMKKHTAKALEGVHKNNSTIRSPKDHEKSWHVSPENTKVH